MTKSDAFKIKVAAFNAAATAYDVAVRDAEATYAFNSNATPPTPTPLEQYRAYIADHRRAVEAVTAELKLARQFADDRANKAYNDLVKLADDAYKAYTATK